MRKGQKASLETRMKMSIARKGRPKSMEHRAKISLTHKNNPCHKNPETWERLAASHIEGSKWWITIHSPEFRKKMSNNMKEKWENSTIREKLCKSAKEKWGNSEIREKLRESMIEGWKKPEVRNKISGSNNSQWRGGIHTSYRPGLTHELRREIRNRDDYLCQNPKCYLPENGRHHSVHHIDFNKDNEDSPNLITLCMKHHSQTGIKNRDYWTEYYRNLQNMRRLISMENLGGFNATV